VSGQPVSGSAQNTQSRRLARAGTSRLAVFTLSAAFLISGVALAVVAIRGPEPPRSLTDRVHSVASTLRCPVCQDLSVADSPSGIAQQMRETIRRDLQAGVTPDQIRAQFVASYGDWILLSPPRSGVNVTVWVVPLLLVLGGLAIGVLAIRRWTSDNDDPGRRGASELSAADRRLLEKAMGSAAGEDPP
jgi:cytochrome c-type biogenesis protein CcmH